MMRRTFRRLLLVVGGCLVLACSPQEQSSDAGGGGGTTVDPVVTMLSISPSDLVMNQLGATASLLLGSDGGLANTDVSWQSSSNAVVTVSAAGVVAAAGEGTATVTASFNSLSATANIIVSTSAFTISGFIYYEDKQYTTTGFTGTRSTFPVRYATVELVDSQDTVLQTAVTGSDGAYALGPFLDTASRVRVLAQTNDASLPPISVTDYSGNIYAAGKTVELNALDAVMDVQITVQSAAGAFNILDVLSYAAEHVAAMTSAAAITGTAMPALNAVWQSGSSSLGTWFCNAYDSSYCPRGAAVYVLGGGGSGNDTDEYDDDVLWHEYSHYLENHFAIADSQGGPHSFTDNDLDLRLAWSEGFGDFFPTAMKAWMRGNHPQHLSIPDTLDTALYIDTYGAFASYINIGNPGNSPFVYASSEIAIAHLLHRLRGNFGMDFIWQVYENSLPAAAGPVNLEAFWDGWLAQFSPDSAALAQLQFTFSNRLIYYMQDAYEDDDTQDLARALTVCAAGQSCGGEQHFLYKNDAAADADFFLFSATAGHVYRIETFGLSNGADTLLRVYDGQGQVLAENDDRAGNICCLPNNGLTLSSSTDFTATATTTYFVEVTAPADSALSAGRYGTYSIKITDNQ